MAEEWWLLHCGTTNGMLPYCWYVIVAIMFYMLFYLTHTRLKTPCSRIFTMTVCWFAYLFATRYIQHWGIWWFNTSHMFLLGFAYYKLEHRIQRLNFYVCTAALLVVGAAASTRTGLLLCNMLFDTSYALIVVAGITIIAFHSKVLDYLGKISYELYLVQAIPLFALLGSDLPPALIGLICITTDVVLASILHKVTQKLHHS